MAEINAYCSICGKGYYICKICEEQRNYKAWRSVVDSLEHYKIYMILHSYTLSGNKEVAREELTHCDLSDIDSFNENIKSVLKEIMNDPEEKIKYVSKKKRVVKNSVSSNDEKDFVNSDLVN